MKNHKRQDNGLLAASEDEETTLGEVVQQRKKWANFGLHFARPLNILTVNKLPVFLPVV